MSGFRASRTLNGTYTPTLRQFDVTLGASNTYYPGDPVALAAGKVIPCTAATSSAVLGVISAIGKKGPNGEFSPVTFNQPNKGTYLAANETGVALVNTDPNQLYIARIDTSASAGLAAKTVRGSAGTANTRAGISGWSLGGSTLGTTAGYMFKIIGLAPTELITGYNDKASGSFVEVKLNRNIMAFEVDAGIS